jgi:hypothetical protein
MWKGEGASIRQHKENGVAWGNLLQRGGEGPARTWITRLSQELNVLSEHGVGKRREALEAMRMFG